MTARGSVDEQLVKLEQLRKSPDSPDAVAELTRAIGGKSNVVAGKGAGIVAAGRVASLEGALIAAFERFVDPALDKGCIAKLAIVRALEALESRAEDVFLRGSRLVQMEASWGKSVDVAVELRCECCMALVRINSRKMMVPLVHLLADENEEARATAARALAGSGRDEAALLLRFKILIGDKEPGVVGECLASFVRLTRSTQLVDTFLDSPDDEVHEMAAMALGESRTAAAAELLIAKLAREFSPGRRKVMLTALAMTRQGAGIDYLLKLIREGGGNGRAALEAMKFFKGDAGMAEKIEAAVRDGGLLSS